MYGEITEDIGAIIRALRCRVAFALGVVLALVQPRHAWPNGELGQAA
jgi:hypothetical protein